MNNYIKMAFLGATLLLSGCLGTQHLQFYDEVFVTIRNDSRTGTLVVDEVDSGRTIAILYPGTQDTRSYRQYETQNCVEEGFLFRYEFKDVAEVQDFVVLNEDRGDGVNLLANIRKDQVARSNTTAKEIRVCFKQRRYDPDKSVVFIVDDNELRSPDVDGPKYVERHY